MLLKDRFVSDELLVLRYLNARMELTEKEKYHYLHLEKGYEGEVKFDRLAENLPEERYILNDLLFKVNGSYFQIDTLMISQGTIYLLDIKNYVDDCYFESDKFYSKITRREYKNPILQLKRSETLFRQLLQNLKQNYLVDAFVIFINPEFSLLQAPMDQPIILPNQVNKFLRDLSTTPSKLNDGHKKLAQKLLSLHQTKNPFTTLPEYQYDQVQKGIFCKTCKSFHVFVKNFDFVCADCGDHERIEVGILRNVKEFKHLFPDRKVTTQSIAEWCKTDLSTKTICRVLKKNYIKFGKTSDTYYQ